MRQLHTWAALAAISVPITIGCSDDNDPDTTADTGPVVIDRDGGANDASNDTEDGEAQGGSGDDGGASEADDGGAALDGGAGSADAGSDANDANEADDQLTDPQIGAVTSAANSGEIAQANAALPKLSNAEVKAFATSMVAMHGAAQARQSMLLQEKQITPEENPTSAMLKRESDAIVAELMAAPAVAVDRLYVERQVLVHGNVLELLEQVLIPSATDADLRAELVATRDEVETHLNEAKQLEEALGAP